MSTVNLYCVGIYFKKDIPFVDDTSGFMSGAAILAGAATLGLRYQVNDGQGFPAANGHIQYLSYTPLASDVATLPHKPTAPQAFPFVGQPLTLVQQLNPLGSISYIFQYTVDQSDLIKTPTGQNPQFTTNAFMPGAKIRVRLLSIYRSSLVLGT